jgi:hypothetical protein
MTTRTSTTKGLDRGPHKEMKAAVPGVGAKLENARSIATERTPKVKAGSGGLPSTYFGNARACGTERGKK